MRGNIARLVDQRGFGFISPTATEDDNRRYFFHSSDLRGGLIFEELRTGDVVEFDAALTDRGPRASNVTAVAEAA